MAKIQAKEKTFQVIVVVLTVIPFVWGFYWMPPIAMFFGAPKWMADLSVPAVWGIAYLATRGWPSLVYSYIEAIRKLLKRIGFDVVYI